MAYNNRNPTYKRNWRISASRTEVKSREQYANLNWKPKFPELIQSDPHLANTVVLEVYDYLEAVALFTAMQKDGMRVQRSWLRRAESGHGVVNAWAS